MIGRFESISHINRRIDRDPMPLNLTARIDAMGPGHPHGHPEVMGPPDNNGAEELLAFR